MNNNADISKSDYLSLAGIVEKTEDHIRSLEKVEDAYAAVAKNTLTDILDNVGSAIEASDDDASVKGVIENAKNKLQEMNGYIAKILSNKQGEQGEDLQ